MKIRQLSAAVLALLCLASVASCGESTQDAPVNTENTTAAVTETETETSSLYEKLGVPENGFGGESYSILCRTDVIDEMYIAEETGDVVEDAVYRRNINVSDKLNIDLQIIDIPGDWVNQTGFVKYVTSGIMAGDDEFQLIAGYMNYMPVTITNDLYLNVSDLPYVDLNNPWWTKGFNDNVTINGNTFAAMGSLCSSMLKYAYCAYFNKTLMDQYDYSSDELYQTVLDGKWTFDKLMSMAKGVSADLNGDGVLDDEHDLYGLCMTYMPIRGLANAFAIDYTTRDKDGLPQLAFYGERLVSAYADVMEALDSSCWNSVNNNYIAFMEDRVLFYYETFNMASYLRPMNSDFGIVPMPKYDEAQKDYRTETVDTTSVLFVPMTVKNPELCGMALECLNYESYRLVIPAFFDKALQTKYARDESSQKMLELIRDSIYYDFGYVFAGMIGGINGTMQLAMEKKDLASFWESNVKGYERNLNKIVEYYRGN